MNLKLSAALLLSGACLAGASRQVVQRSNVFQLSDPFKGGIGSFIKEGSAVATLTRTKAGVGLHFKSQGLPKGTYTIWFFVMNDPSLCANFGGYPYECDFTDAAKKEISAILGASGDVVSDNGEFSAVSWIPVQQAADDEVAQLLPGSVTGELINPFSSEIHIDILYHGEPLPLGDGTSIDSLEGQLRFTKGGCQNYLVNGGMEPAPTSSNSSDPSSVVCPSIQSAVFEAVQDPIPGTTVARNSVQGKSHP